MSVWSWLTSEVAELSTFASLVADGAAGEPVDLWQWLVSTSPETVYGALGTTTLAVLFATDRIMTKGQHDRRTADLKEHHAREIAELTRSRDGWKAAYERERDRADTATDSMAEMGGSLADIGHVLKSLDRALPAHPPRGDRDE